MAELSFNNIEFKAPHSAIISLSNGDTVDVHPFTLMEQLIYACISEDDVEEELEGIVDSLYEKIEYHGNFKEENA